MELETDYLVVGAGAAGMGFADSLLDSSDADIVVVDRRAAPGGHWLEAYPFVRLHQPSGWYGVGAVSLGEDRIEQTGPETGWYSRASGSQIVDYFAGVMRDRLLSSGRVRFLGLAEHLGDGRIRSLEDGREHDVHARRAIVDATYTSSPTPESSPAPFQVEDGVRLVTPGGLAALGDLGRGVVVIGAGKTASDTCSWLLDRGCDPASITWIRSRDMWFNNRAYLQPGRLSGGIVEGTVHWLEALAACGTVDEVFAQVESRGVIRRLDVEVWPTVFRGPTISDVEIAQLRSIRNVVRLGHVRSIELNRITLDEGTVPTSPEQVHVHCAASGLTYNPAVPIFASDRITVQFITRTNIPLSSAAIARVEALDITVEEKNALCRPIPLYETPLGSLQMLLGGIRSEGVWRKHPILGPWLGGHRLNLTRDAAAALGDDAAHWYGRLTAALAPAYESLARLSS
ncbi:NAD(P)-binding protein [Nocardioides bizhenqiangii]|uniref:NAD(P)-binding protein n=1 Tax=Nocardioides bizhenqiangii TaxID=3095076 RepID=A0ABZ0ZKH9_9ACTN|nr:NAD(P)-binding protein [Nocardioides sp. HM61]WQQ24896.1 NAD(P)-binding protein [Nocardioides sp. HM61]